MDIKSTLASQNVARTQTTPAKRTDGPQGPAQSQGAQGAVSVSVSGGARGASSVAESVNDNLSREDALALASAVADELATLPSGSGIVSNPALLEEAARGV
jgi:hypothetical protein